ncbi:hypothetical protein [Georgenia sp. AZ-5]|uniref:hypothetical protein n=1 Tax=Georgenia sp. AZ-5 TaxID=3367526 RepID=UPI0037553EDE
MSTSDPGVAGGPLPALTPPPLDPLAVASLALGLLAIVPVLALAAVACGHLALHRAASARGRGRAMAGVARGYSPAGRALAVAGSALGWVMTTVWALAVAAVLLLGG